MGEHTTKMASLESFCKVPPGGCERERDGRKFKRKLSEVNTRAVSREQNKLICKFKGAGYGVHIHSSRNQKGVGEI